MKYPVTAYGIFNALMSGKALSAKGIAEVANIDTTSENLNEIRWQLLSAQELDKAIVADECAGITFWSLLKD